MGNEITTYYLLAVNCGESSDAFGVWILNTYLYGSSRILRSFLKDCSWSVGDPYGRPKIGILTIIIKLYPE